jgi:glycosyltransferase involved in cell wall biosynthesis
VTGYRVPVGDIETLAERIVRLLEDPPACQQFGRRGREIALTRFTAERAANKTYDLYRAMLPAVP